MCIRDRYYLHFVLTYYCYNIKFYKLLFFSYRLLMPRSLDFLYTVIITYFLSFMKLNYFKPVSYTHLDVYKRQHYTFAPLRTFLCIGKY